MKPTDTIYCLDTSALIDMRSLYPADKFPEVWDTLAELAQTERVISPVQTLHELRRKGDAELLAWAEATPELFHDLGSEQADLAREIATRYGKLFDADDATSEAVPFVIALAVAHRARKGSAGQEYEVIADGLIRTRLDLIAVCEDPAYDVGFMSSIFMLRELELKVPAPPGSLMDLWGIWKDLGITEEDIEASRIVFKGSLR